MALSLLKGSVVTAKLWVPIDKVESGALTQLRNAASLSWARHVLAMPDIHQGEGVAIGSVIALKGAVSPNIVGVDIGCGMCAIRTTLPVGKLGDLHALREMIENTIPIGTGCAHGTPVKRPLWVAPKDWDELWDGVKRAERGRCEFETAKAQLGTLGSGNHFVEVCVEDSTGHVWLVLHSGSRNLGKEICQTHARNAPSLECNRIIPDRALSVFLQGTPQFDAYWRDMQIAQWYAKLNRGVMMDLLQNVLRENVDAFETDIYVNCHHNYAEMEEHFGEQLVVSRKGAIKVGTGLGIIPGAMGRKSYIVQGTGCHEALLSASHGAGRQMSRGEAKRRFTVEDAKEQMQGVECHLGKGILDELPEAYKDLDEVMEYQKDLVQPIHELRAILTVKGHDDRTNQERKANEKEWKRQRREEREAKQRGH